MIAFAAVGGALGSRRAGRLGRASGFACGGCSAGDGRTSAPAIAGARRPGSERPGRRFGTAMRRRRVAGRRLAVFARWTLGDRVPRSPAAPARADAVAGARRGLPSGTLCDRICRFFGGSVLGCRCAAFSLAQAWRGPSRAMAPTPIAAKPQGVPLRAVRRRRCRLRRPGFAFTRHALGRGLSGRPLFRLTIRAHRGRLRRTPAAPPPAWARRAVGSRGRPHRRIRRCVSRNRRLGRPLGIRGRRAAAALGGCRPIARGTLLDGDAGRCVTRVQARLLLLAGGNRRRFFRQEANSSARHKAREAGRDSPARRLPRNPAISRRYAEPGAAERRLTAHAALVACPRDPRRLERSRTAAAPARTETTSRPSARPASGYARRSRSPRPAGPRLAQSTLTASSSPSQPLPVRRVASARLPVNLVRRLSAVCDGAHKCENFFMAGVGCSADTSAGFAAVFVCLHSVRRRQTAAKKGRRSHREMANG